MIQLWNIVIYLFATYGDVTSGNIQGLLRVQFFEESVGQWAQRCMPFELDLAGLGSGGLL